MVRVFIAAACITLAATACQAARELHAVQGNWTLAGSQARIADPGDNWAIATAPGVRGDLTIEADLDWQPTGKSARVGFVLGYVNPENYAMCVLDKKPYKAWNGPTEEDLYTISYYLISGDNETLCNVCPLQDPSPGKRHLKVMLAGTQFLASLDGKPALQGILFGQLYAGTVGVAARYAGASFSNIKVSQTPFDTRLYGMQNVAHDSSGRVLSRWPYKDMITRPCEFVFWAADNAVGNWLRDEEGRKWPPYVYACTINLNGTVGNPTNYIPQEFTSTTRASWTTTCSPATSGASIAPSSSPTGCSSLRT